MSVLKFLVLYGAGDLAAKFSFDPDFYRLSLAAVSRGLLIAAGRATTIALFAKTANLQAIERSEPKTR